MLNKVEGLPRSCDVGMTLQMLVILTTVRDRLARRNFIHCVQFLPDSTHQQHQTPRSTILTTKTYALQHPLLHSMLTILSLRQGRLPSHVPKVWSALYCPSALYTMMIQEKKVRIRMHLEVSPRLRRVIASIPRKETKRKRSDAQLPSCPALPRYQGLTKPRFHRGSASAKLWMFVPT